MKVNKKILIIGGTGFIGYHLAKKSLKKGWLVTSISSNQPKQKRYLSKVKYIFCKGNLVRTFASEARISDFWDFGLTDFDFHLRKSIPDIQNPQNFLTASYTTKRKSGNFHIPLYM